MIDDSNLIYQLLLSIGFFIILTFFSLPILHYFSNLLSSIGVYHKNERFIIRIALLYRAYVILSVPVIFAVATILANTGVITSILDALVIAIGSYVIFPITLRVLSLAKQPSPYVFNIINWKSKAEYNGQQTVDDEKHALLCERKERFISSVFSIILIAWIIYIIIMPVYIYLNGATMLDTLLQQLKLQYQSTFILILFFLGLPLIYAILGELCLKIVGVDDLMKIE